MAGVTVSGVLWAVFQNNAGGAWDNAKKSFEAGVMIDGEMTYKGSEAHKAAVTGDTVGDPFKDTSGPSMNILIKLTCLVGLVIAPILGDGHGDDSAAAGNCVKTEQCEKGKDHCKKDGYCKKDGHGKKAAACKDKNSCKGQSCKSNDMCSKCDMSKMKDMTKEECAAYCKEKGCSQECTDACLSHYDEEGNFKCGEGKCGEGKCGHGDATEY